MILTVVRIRWFVMDDTVGGGLWVIVVLAIVFAVSGLL